MVSYKKKGIIDLSRIISYGTSVMLAWVIFPAWVHAGALLWQITGMEGVENRYAIASRIEKRLPQDRTNAESVWSMEGSFYSTAAAVMRFEIWNCLRNLAGEKVKVAPSYRDLIGSGIISVNSIEMPEMMGNIER